MAGVQSVTTGVAQGLILHTATGGWSLAVGAAKSMLPGLLMMTGIALSGKKGMVAYFIERGASDSAFLAATAGALLDQAQDKSVSATSFTKTQRTVFLSTTTTVGHEADRLGVAINTYMDLVDRVLKGEAGNEDYIPLLFGGGNSSD